MATKEDDLVTYETPLFDFDEITDHCSSGNGSEEDYDINYFNGDYILADLLSVEIKEIENTYVLEFDSYQKQTQENVKDKPSQSKEQLQNNPSQSTVQFIEQIQNKPKQQLILSTYNFKEFKCPHLDCNKIFKSQISLKFHKLSHGVNSERFKCDQCTKTFLSPQYLAVHKKLHMDVYCDICNAKFNAKSALNRHMFTSHKKTVVCMYCRYKVFTDRQLTEHIDKCHSHLRTAPQETKVENNNNVPKPEESTPKITYFFGLQFKNN